MVDKLSSRKKTKKESSPHNPHFPKNVPAKKQQTKHTEQGAPGSQRTKHHLMASLNNVRGRPLVTEPQEQQAPKTSTARTQSQAVRLALVATQSVNTIAQ